MRQIPLILINLFEHLRENLLDSEDAVKGNERIHPDLVTEASALTTWEPESSWTITDRKSATVDMLFLASEPWRLHVYPRRDP